MDGQANDMQLSRPAAIQLRIGWRLQSNGGFATLLQPASACPGGRQKALVTDWKRY
jgi:hypothetical protein